MDLQGAPSTIIDELASRFDADFVALSDFPLTEGANWVHHHTALPPELHALWEESFARGTLWLHSEWKHDFAALAEIAKSSQMETSGFVRDFMKPLGLSPEGSLGGVREATADAPAVAWTVMSRRAFRPDEVKFARRLHPHLVTALQLEAKWRGAMDLLEATRRPLDQSRTGVLILDISGRLVWHNRRAQRLLGESDGLCLKNGRLKATSAADDRQIQTDLSDFSKSAAGEVVETAPRIMRIERNQGRMALALVLVPPSENGWRGRQGVINVFILDPGAEAAPTAEVLHVLFGLTKAEAKLALAIARGETAKDFAARMGRSIQTVRTQLKFVFRKVGVKRQIDLVRVMNLGVPVSSSDTEIVPKTRPKAP